MEEIKTKLRALVQDNEKSSVQPFEYSTSKIFTLTEPNVNSVSKVTINGNDLASGETYVFDANTNTVTLTADLEEKDIITIYFKYSNYSDTELTDYISSALTHLSVNGYTQAGTVFTIASGNVIEPTPTEKDENLIALVASILIKPNFISYKLPTVSVTYPKNLDIEDKIGKLIGRFKQTGVGIFDTIDIYEDD